MLQDYKLGIRMLVKYPGLTIAGGLALAIAIGIGAGWYDLWGKILAPTMPVPEGDRIVLIETQNVLTNEPERRAVRDFLEWRRELRTIEGLGAYRTAIRNLIADNAVPEPIQSRSSRLLRSARHVWLPYSAALCSTLTRRPEHQWWCSGTTCGSAPSGVGKTFSDRLQSSETHRPPSSVSCRTVSVTPSTTTHGCRCSSANRMARSKAAPSASSAGWRLASRARRQMRSFACWESALPRRCQLRTSVSGPE